MIIGRTRSVIVSTSLCLLVTYAILTFVPAGGSPLTSLHLMAIFPLDLTSGLKTLLLTIILFVGPLYEHLICHNQWRSLFNSHGYASIYTDLSNYRNLIVGPISEELLFRSAALPLFLLTQKAGEMSFKTLFLIPPLIFGLAHVHHVYEFKIANPRAPIMMGIARSVIQLCYTTFFGSFAAFSFLRTGSLLGPILAHTFCNFMGLPRFFGRVQGPNQEEHEHVHVDTAGAEPLMGPDTGDKRDDDATQPPRDGLLEQQDEGPQELHVLYSVLYYILLVAGACGFYRYMWALTESKNALVDFK